MESRGRYKGCNVNRVFVSRFAPRAMGERERSTALAIGKGRVRAAQPESTGMSSQRRDCGEAPTFQAARRS